MTPVGQLDVYMFAKTIFFKLGPKILLSVLFSACLATPRCKQKSVITLKIYFIKWWCTLTVSFFLASEPLCIPFIVCHLAAEQTDWQKDHELTKPCFLSLCPEVSVAAFSRADCQSCHSLVVTPELSGMLNENPETG